MQNVFNIAHDGT